METKIRSVFLSNIFCKGQAFFVKRFFVRFGFLLCKIYMVLFFIYKTVAKQLFFDVSNNMSNYVSSNTIYLNSKIFYKFLNFKKQKG